MVYVTKQNVYYEIKDVSLDLFDYCKCIAHVPYRYSLEKLPTKPLKNRTRRQLSPFR